VLSLPVPIPNSDDTSRAFSLFYAFPLDRRTLSAGAPDFPREGSAKSSSLNLDPVGLYPCEETLLREHFAPKQPLSLPPMMAEDLLRPSRPYGKRRPPGGARSEEHGSLSSLPPPQTRLFSCFLRREKPRLRPRRKGKAGPILSSNPTWISLSFAKFF